MNTEKKSVLPEHEHLYREFDKQKQRKFIKRKISAWLYLMCSIRKYIFSKYYHGDSI
jgi:hypothetical protein